MYQSALKQKRSQLLVSHPLLSNQEKMNSLNRLCSQGWRWSRGKLQVQSCIWLYCQWPLNSDRLSVDTTLTLDWAAHSLTTPSSGTEWNHRRFSELLSGIIFSVWPVNIWDEWILEALGCCSYFYWMCCICVPKDLFALSKFANTFLPLCFLCKWEL